MESSVFASLLSLYCHRFFSSFATKVTIERTDDRLVDWKQPWQLSRLICFDWLSDYYGGLSLWLASACIEQLKHKHISKRIKEPTCIFPPIFICVEASSATLLGNSRFVRKGATLFIIASRSCQWQEMRNCSAEYPEGSRPEDKKVLLAEWSVHVWKLKDHCTMAGSGPVNWAN